MFDYTTFFTRVGKCVKAINALLLEQAVVSGYGTGILDQYNAHRDLVLTVQTSFNGFQSNIAGWERTIKNTIDATLQDAGVALAVASTDPTTILTALAAQMVLDGQTVQRCTVSAPVITANTTNTGTGTLLIGGTSSELQISEVLKATCVIDSYSGATVGAERFSLVGYPKADAFSDATRGNGTLASQLVCMDGGANLILNGGFESFTATNQPASWTVVTGTTCITKETSNTFTGTGALKLAGNGTTNAVTLTQSLANKVKARSNLIVAAHLRKSGTVSSGSTLAITISGTGISSLTLYSADPSTLTTGYVLSSLLSSIGNVAPSDIKLSISWTNATAAGAAAVLLIDDILVGVPPVFGGVQYVVLKGATPFVFGDQFTVTTANNYAGVFQTFFARFYGVTLPSAASPTISDSLAA